MTEQQVQEIDDEEGELGVEVYLYPGESGDAIEHRHIVLGEEPMVLLEASRDGEGGYVLEYFGSMINSMEELLEFLEGYTDSLKSVLQDLAEEAARV